MEKWHWITLILCAFGLFKEFRPSEPFVTEYLIHDKNFTKETIVQVAYPIATYTYLGTLPIVFLITDFLRYKPVIILEGIAFVVTYTLLIWGNGITNLRIVEILYGIAMSTEVAYYTYIYAKVDKNEYKKVTSYTYTAILVGNFGAAVLSQLLVSYEWMNYHQLNYLTLGGVSIALVIACFLPGVQKSIYFYRKETSPDECESGDAIPDSQYDSLTVAQRVRRAYRMLWYDFVKAFSNPYVVKWSIWWAIASAGFLQVINYVQPLYETIHPYTEGNIYNAGVDAVHTLLSSVIALIIGRVTLPWRKWGESLLFLISLIQGAVLVWMSQTGSIFVAYACYVVFRTMYQVMITVASSEVAQGISDDSYGLIFGINRFFSLILQSLLTLIINDENGLALGERSQFLVYGIYFGSIGVLFGGAVLVTLIRYGGIEGPSSPEGSRNCIEDSSALNREYGGETNSVKSDRIQEL